MLLGHFDLAPFGGGFAGVDVFFVLSGFLITAQCADAGDSLPWRRIGIYLRRFWRIAPAYLAVVAATAFIGAHLMLADDARRLETSALASALFAANLYFNNDLGYFAPSAIYSPLLHLWSLGVEAQFYLVWPLAIRFALPRPTWRRLGDRRRDRRGLVRAVGRVVVPRRQDRVLLPAVAAVGIRRRRGGRARAAIRRPRRPMAPRRPPRRGGARCAVGRAVPV